MNTQPQHHPHRWHLSLLPSTRLGWWSMVLAVVSLISLGAFVALVNAGQRGGQSFSDNWLLTGSILVVLVAAVAGLVTAVVAVIRNREGGLVLALPVLWGLVVASFALGEFINPH